MKKLLFAILAIGHFSLNCVIGQSSCTPAPPGLVSWWPGDGDTADIISTNNGTLIGGASFATSEVSQGFNFSGNGQWVEVADNPSLSFGNDFTIEFWYKDGGLGSGAYGGLIAKRPTSPDNAPCNFGLTIVAPSTFLIYFLDPNYGGYQSLSYQGLPPAGGFHHLAASFHQAPGEQVSLKAYVDGQLVSSNSVPGLLSRTTNSAPVTIGASNASGEFFKGIIDEISIYSRALDDSEIASIYSAGSSGKCKSTPPHILVQPVSQQVFAGTNINLNVVATGQFPLEYQWFLGGSSIAGATDSALNLTNVQVSQSGTYTVQITNAFGIVLSSNAVLTVLPPPPCTPPPSGLISWWSGEGDPSDSVGMNNGVVTNGAAFGSGEVGQSFQFNGAGSYVQILDSPSLSFTNDFTIELWYKDGGIAPGAYAGLIGKRPLNGPCNYGMTIVKTSPATLLVYFEDPKYGSYQGLRYQGLPPAGAFHHVAATFHQDPSDQLVVCAFVDGQPVQTNSFSGSLSRTTNNAAVDIGCSNPNGEWFKGNIDEVSIYGRLLSDSEITSIFQSGSLGKCSTPIPAHIYQQPGNQTVVVGQTATLTVGGAGTSPLSYQWSFNSNPVPAATNASLMLTNVQMSQAGVYSVTVTNAYGMDTSSNATLTVAFPPASVYVVNTSGTAGDVLNVPVVLIANGNENTIGFSLNFSPSLLTCVGVSLGSGTTGGNLQFNTNQQGSVGVGIALSSSSTFAPGTQEVAVISFISAVSGHGYSVPLSFGNVPTAGELADAGANRLQVNFHNGQATLTRSAIEGDVSPRADGDGSVTIVDWVQVGRYVAALDSPTNASEFQRADCAPRSSMGDGLLTVSDWVQAGRYAVGLDPITSAGGPTVPSGGGVVARSHKQGNDPLRTVIVQGPLIFQGQTASAQVELNAQGDENAIGLSLTFDPKVVSYTSATLGSDAANATMVINAIQATNGQLGLIMELPTGTSFSPGTRQVLKVNFQAVTTASVDSAVSLTDLPVRREVSDTNALPVVATYSNGLISVNPKPALAIAHSGQNINMSWPTWATNYTLQQGLSNVLPSNTWSNLTASPVLTNNAFSVTIPVSGSVQFYRLQHQ
jgi:hypothetical protein